MARNQARAPKGAQLDVPSCGVPVPVGMPVRSVRLPDRLWRRLEEVRDRANRSRPDPVSLSSVVRALLEQALASGQPPDFEAGIWRPSRVRHERAATAAKSRALDEAQAVYQRFSDLIDRHQVTPPAFAKAIGRDREEARSFFQCGRLPDGDPVDFLDRVKAWIAEHAGDG